MRPFLSVWSKMSVRVAPVTSFSRASTRGYTLSFTYMQKAMRLSLIYSKLSAKLSPSMLSTRSSCTEAG